MKTTKWTHFWDMHSGGEQKLDWGHIFIEAPEDEAKVIFYNRFHRNPERVTCTCCGGDYSISEEESLEQATAYQRGCRYAYMKDGKGISQEEGWKSGKGVVKGVWAGYVEEPDNEFKMNRYQPLKEYIKNKDVKVIFAKDIKASERKGDVPEEGYVWQE